MPGVQAAFGWQRGEVERQISERVEVAERRIFALRSQGMRFGELHHTECGRHIGVPFISRMGEASRLQEQDDRRSRELTLLGRLVTVHRV